jgi:hypothetical protein
MWNDIEDGLPEIKGLGAKVKVRLSDKSEVFAFFYPDKMQWISFYGEKACYFWHSKTRLPLFNVTHWKSLIE